MMIRSLERYLSKEIRIYEFTLEHPKYISVSCHQERVKLLLKGNMYVRYGSYKDLIWSWPLFNGHRVRLYPSKDRRRKYYYVYSMIVVEQWSDKISPSLISQQVYYILGHSKWTPNKGIPLTNNSFEKVLKGVQIEGSIIDRPL